MLEPPDDAGTSTLDLIARARTSLAEARSLPDIRRVMEMVRGGQPEEAPVQLAGRTLHPFGGPVSWWVEKGDLVFSSKPDLVCGALDGQAPSMVDHPVRAALMRKSDALEPVAAAFFDLTAAPPLPPRASGPAG